MSFKEGDRVRRKHEALDKGNWTFGRRTMTVASCYDGRVRFVEETGFFMPPFHIADNFELEPIMQEVKVMLTDDQLALPLSTTLDLALATLGRAIGYDLRVRFAERILTITAQAD